MFETKGAEVSMIRIKEGLLGVGVVVMGAGVVLLGVGVVVLCEFVVLNKNCLRLRDPWSRCFG